MEALVEQSKMYTKIGEEAAELREKLARYESGWISVEDGLPEDDPGVDKYDDGNLAFCTVLYCDSDGIVAQANRRILRHDFCECKATNGWEWCTNANITHWMPMPKPSKSTLKESVEKEDE